MEFGLSGQYRAFLLPEAEVELNGFLKKNNPKARDRVNANEERGHVIASLVLSDDSGVCELGSQLRTTSRIFSNLHRQSRGVSHLFARRAAGPGMTVIAYPQVAGNFSQRRDRRSISVTYFERL